jgi:hypothetical protein
MHATVRALSDAGEVTARRRTTTDDLEFAAEWLEAYEGDPDDDGENLTALATVARRLRREAARRRAPGTQAVGVVRKHKPKETTS